MNDQAANIKFVREVEKHPVLYNYSLPGYSRRDETERAWTEVGRQVDMTVPECKDKWKNLRTVYARRIRLPPNGTAGRRRKAYYLADVMQFALPFIKTAPTYISGTWSEATEKDQSALQEDSDELTINMDYCEDQEHDSPSDGKSATAQPSQPPALPLLAPKPSTSTFATAQVKNRAIEKRDSSPQRTCKHVTKQKQTNVEANKAVTAYFKAKKARLAAMARRGRAEDEREDSLKMFLLSLMPELLQLSDVQVKLFKRRVFGLIDDVAVMEKSSSEDSSKKSSAATTT